MAQGEPRRTTPVRRDVTFRQPVPMFRDYQGSKKAAQRRLEAGDLFVLGLAIGVPEPVG